MTPLFSIITCTFNAESTLERTLSSIVSQTFENKELILIDGASKDRTMEIAKGFHIDTIICEKDKGLYDAMNKGIKAAKGEYLIFLNAGDKFHGDDCLTRVAAKLDGTQDVVYGQTALVNEDGEFLGMRRLKAPQKLNWKSFRNGMLVCHQAFWVKREIAALTPYNLEYRFSSDIDWCIRVMKQSKVLLNASDTLIDYLSEGMTTKNRWKSLWERYRILKKHYGTADAIIHHLWFAIRLLIK